MIELLCVLLLCVFSVLYSVPRLGCYKHGDNFVNKTIEGIVNSATTGYYASTLNSQNFDGKKFSGKSSLNICASLPNFFPAKISHFNNVL